MMDKGIFVTATDTDVGKTFISALLVKALRAKNVNAGYFKPALSGAVQRDGKLIPGDAEYVCKAAGLEGNPADYVAYIFERAVSPHLAARLERRSITPAGILERFRQVAPRFEYMVAEGCGGLCCPLRLDGESFLLEEVAALLGYPLLIVSHAGLGGIHGAVTTFRYAQSLSLPVCGIVLNRYEPGNLIHEDNRVQIGRFTGVPVVCVEKNQEVFPEIGLLTNGIVPVKTPRK